MCGYGAIVSQGEHLHDVLTGQHLTFLQPADSSGEVLQVEVRLDPGGFVPRHLHARQDERVEVLSGMLTVKVGRAERRLGVGEVAHVHRRRVHVVRNAGVNEARFLLEVRPARHMEGFMRGLFAVINMFRPLARFRRSKGAA